MNDVTSLEKCKRYSIVHDHKKLMSLKYSRKIITLIDEICYIYEWLKIS